MSNRSARSKFSPVDASTIVTLSTLQQVCNPIPGHLVAKLARKHGLDGQARSFRVWSHAAPLLSAQLSHAIGLNNVCGVQPGQAAGRTDRCILEFRSGVCFYRS
ncbi:MAG: DUF4372 domain-containing protein [Candidatus Hydrogenedentes bacterium]|nr:DUF4372 domain-containing protein [Candidatus Hydrogenedentota bacterium]